LLHQEGGVHGWQYDHAIQRSWILVALLRHARAVIAASDGSSPAIDSAEIIRQLGRLQVQASLYDPNPTYFWDEATALMRGWNRDGSAKMLLPDASVPHPVAVPAVGLRCPEHDAARDPDLQLAHHMRNPFFMLTRPSQSPPPAPMGAAPGVLVPIPTVPDQEVLAQQAIVLALAQRDKSVADATAAEPDPVAWTPELLKELSIKLAVQFGPCPVTEATAMEDINGWPGMQSALAAPHNGGMASFVTKMWRGANLGWASRGGKMNIGGSGITGGSRSGARLETRVTKQWLKALTILVQE